MKFFVPLRLLLLGWLPALAVWMAAAFVVAFAVVANMPLTWIEAMRAPVRDWLPWTLAAPLLFRLVNRHPFERESWIERLATHVVVLACVTLLAWSWARFLDIRPPGFDRFGGPMEKRFPRFGPRFEETMGSLEESPPNEFMRISRGAIVRLALVRAVRPAHGEAPAAVTLAGGVELPLTRGMREVQERLKSG